MDAHRRQVDGIHPPEHHLQSSQEVSNGEKEKESKREEEGIPVCLGLGRGFFSCYSTRLTVQLD